MDVAEQRALIVPCVASELRASTAFLVCFVLEYISSSAFHCISSVEANRISSDAEGHEGDCLVR